jgi:DNA-binding IclR family transcriptional regulator
MLEFDVAEETYRLAPSCLSFGRAFQFSRSELGSANGLLRAFARDNLINVGLSAPDHTHMVYITTFREGRGAQTRTVAAGLRLPIETCSPGIAYLASAPTQERAKIFSLLESLHGEEWPKVRAALNEEIRNTRKRGYSFASSAFGNAGVGTTVTGPQGSIYGINASYLAAAGLPPGLTQEDLGRKLIELARAVESLWSPTSRSASATAL